MLQSSATFFFHAAAFSSVFPSCRSILLHSSCHGIWQHFSSCRSVWMAFCVVPQGLEALHSARQCFSFVLQHFARFLMLQHSETFFFMLQCFLLQCATVIRLCCGIRLCHSSSCSIFLDAAEFSNIFLPCHGIWQHFSFVLQHFATFLMPRHSATFFFMPQCFLPQHATVIRLCCGIRLCRSSSCSIFLDAAEFGNIFLPCRGIRQRFSFVPQHFATFLMPQDSATFFFVLQCLDGILHHAAGFGGIARHAAVIGSTNKSNVGNGGICFRKSLAGAKTSETFRKGETGNN